MEKIKRKNSFIPDNTKTTNLDAFTSKTYRVLSWRRNPYCKQPKKLIEKKHSQSKGNKPSSLQFHPQPGHLSSPSCCEQMFPLSLFGLVSLETSPSDSLCQFETMASHLGTFNLIHPTPNSTVTGVISLFLESLAVTSP